MRSQDPILRREVLVLQQQFLIDQTGCIRPANVSIGYLSSRDFIIKPAFPRSGIFCPYGDSKTQYNVNSTTYRASDDTYDDEKQWKAH